MADQFDSTVRATNALTATNEYYSSELARVVKAYADLDQLHRRLLEQMLDGNRRATAGSVLAAAVERMCTTEYQKAVLASSCKSKTPVPFNAVSHWDLTAALAKYAAAVKAPTGG